MLHCPLFLLRLGERLPHNANTTMNHRSPYLHHESSLGVLPNSVNIQYFLHHTGIPNQFHFSFHLSSTQRVQTTCALGIHYHNCQTQRCIMTSALRFANQLKVPHLRLVPLPSLHRFIAHTSACCPVTHGLFSSRGAVLPLH